MGKPLPVGAEVHHVNGNKAESRGGNLVICQDTAYHHLLERRTRAYRASGHTHYRRCTFCKKWDDPALMYVAPAVSGWAAHYPCKRKHEREYRKKRNVIDPLPLPSEA